MFLIVRIIGRPSPLPDGVWHNTEVADIHIEPVHAVLPCLTRGVRSEVAKLCPCAYLACCPVRTVLAKNIVVTSGTSNENTFNTENTYMSPVALFWVVITAEPTTPGIPVADVVHNTADSLLHLVFSQLVKPILPLGESE
jgi:hypothetical protein